MEQVWNILERETLGVWMSRTWELFVLDAWKNRIKSEQIPNTEFIMVFQDVVW